MQYSPVSHRVQDVDWRDEITEALELFYEQTMQLPHSIEKSLRTLSE